MSHTRFRSIGFCCLALVLAVSSRPLWASPLKTKQPTLKEVEATPESFLGSRIVVEAWLSNEVKGGDGAQELPVYHDSKTRANRLRVLASKSLADQVKEIGGLRSVTLTGTIAAPESVRAGYSFEVEEIVVKNNDGQTVATLKPAVIAPVVGERPVIEATKTEPTTKAKTGEAQKKSDKVSTVLILVAGGLGLFIVVAGIVGLRLMKHLKKPTGAPVDSKGAKRPAQSRIKISSEPVGRESR